MGFLVIAAKDLRILLRDRSALVFLFGLPLVFVFTFGMIFGGRSSSRSAARIVILAANRDQGAYGASLIAELRHLGLKVETTATEEQVEDAVGGGDRSLGLVIPPGFSRALEVAVAGAGNDGGAPPAHVRVLADPAQAQVASIARGAVLGAAQRIAVPLYMAQMPPAFRAFAEQQASSALRSPVALDMPSAPQSGPASGPSPGDVIIPGFLVYFVFFMANGVAATLITERHEGTLRRILSAPISASQVLLGKLLARALLGALQTAILLLIGVQVMQLHLAHALPGVVVVAAATIFAATGLGLLIATLGKTMEQIQGMTTLALLLMGTLSGCLIPRMFLPQSLQSLSRITPHAWALNAYQDLILRDRTLFSTLPNIAVVIAFGAGFFALALSRFRYE